MVWSSSYSTNYINNVEYLLQHDYSFSLYNCGSDLKNFSCLLSAEFSSYLVFSVLKYILKFFRLSREQCKSLILNGEYR